ncbi:hypothetical protein I4U23_003756 [Adineta vaga]|nr:hypothetical protein I4U23_003756 [Adineta vaga]
MTCDNSQLESEIKKYELYSKIDLSFRQLTDQDMHIVTQQAIIEKQCTALLLNDNRITSEGVAILAKALYNNTRLEDIGLGQNQISDVGVQHIAEMLKTNTTISRLWLFYNQISDQGIKFLADVLIHHNQHLQWLDLRLNKLMTDSCFDFIRDILEQNRSLHKLWMEYCNLSKPVKEKIREIGQAKEDFEIGA